MRVVRALHARLAYRRRVQVLSDAIAQLVPVKSAVLDVGCGDGLIASLIRIRRADVTIEGADVMLRPLVHIQVTEFDGNTLPWSDGAFDGSLLIDVLHHAANAPQLLSEAKRVSRSFVIVKDHIAGGRLDRVVLRLMDWVGNAPHGIGLTYRYFTEEEWIEMFGRAGLGISSWNDRLALYPPRSLWLAGRSLHFAARLERRGQDVEAEDKPEQVTDDHIHYAAS